jgi:hypothetical protein
MVPLGLVVLTLIMIAAPVMDCMAEGGAAAAGQQSLGLDICSVASETLSVPMPFPVEQPRPARDLVVLRFPPPLPHVFDHPPRMA